MKFAPRPFFACSALVFIAAAGFSIGNVVIAERAGMMSCSTKAIMRFEDMDHENINGNVYFNFGAQGNGSMVIEGYTDSAGGRRYLQRYVSFNYSSKRVSATDRQYRLSHWKSSASPIDESSDIIFNYFMLEMSDSQDGLFLNAQKLDGKTILLSSINSPLFICALRSGSKLN